ncbi:hypothetical protein T4B_13174 [Trichinella pseudospiralis]|uniref:Uncharacterized protein n=2 Tax=Trichinella pseudospiralis TaxID=6337 RepID=A0A0V1IDB7_TRIPS|nr:hypothetical protein T4E_8622 [Trichinella pseudospiralis]KRY87366.1 hypothetical protein T4D_2665 [Trichinella pseudospiralis]KRZ20803.1 hypothetical protein T4B_13174 [Trichinella pseudospiralis]
MIQCRRCSVIDWHVSGRQSTKLRPQVEIVGAPAVELVKNDATEKVLKPVGFILAGRRFD